MNKKVGLLIFVVVGMSVSCADRMKRVDADTPSTAAKQVAAAEDASYVTEFSFPKGSAELSDRAKMDLRKVISDAERSGKIKELRVVTWGDAEYPTTKEKKLSSAEIDLVKKRNEAIRDYIKDFDRKIDVDSYSMAERPSAFREMFNTADVRLKKSLEVAEGAGKGKEKASKSIIMVIQE